MSKKIQKNEIEKINDKEEEKLKLLNKKEYTDKEILYKALEKNLKDWKKILFIKLYFTFYDMIILYLPISKGLLIDNISSLKDFDKIFNSFKNYILILFLRSISNIISHIIYSLNKERDLNNKLLLNKIVEKDIYFFEIYKTGELIGKLRDLDNCQLNILEDIFQIIRCLLKIIIIGYYLITTSLYLTLVFAIMLSISTITEKILNFCNIKQENIIDKINQYRNKINELFTNIRMIKSFVKEKEEVKSLENYSISVDINYSNKFYALAEINNFINSLNYPILLIFAGKFILEGKCTLGIFTVFQQYKYEFQVSYSSIKDNYISIKDKIKKWEKFLELYEFPVKIKSVKNYIPKEIRGKINFENVSFSYPLRPATNILNNLTFSIEPGKTFAICGISGSGKTTISNLIERFYDIHKGNIYIDDIDIKDYNIEYLRKMIGLVEQEPVLNSGTILSNITYGVESYEESDLEEVLKLTNIDSFVRDKILFPDGLNTLVGERGIRVSGGQKQRIAIARALMKKSKILIFDESTSALDAQSEDEVQKAIDNIVKKKKNTIIIIAHRLSTIINADIIGVLKKGKIVEIGNHKELMDKNGEYKKLFEKQFLK